MAAVVSIPAPLLDSAASRILTERLGQARLPFLDTEEPEPGLDSLLPATETPGTLGTEGFQAPYRIGLQALEQVQTGNVRSQAPAPDLPLPPATASAPAPLPPDPTGSILFQAHLGVLAAGQVQATGTLAPEAADVLRVNAVPAGAATRTFSEGRPANPGVGQAGRGTPIAAPPALPADGFAAYGPAGNAVAALAPIGRFLDRTE